MLKGISPLLTGDLLKALCDMGHGNQLIIADANFPAAALARQVIRLPGADAVEVLNAILPLFPLDCWSECPAHVMELTEGDKAAGAPAPAMWQIFDDALKAADGMGRLGKIDRFQLYDCAKTACLVIQTGEMRPYGNLVLTKGVVKG